MSTSLALGCVSSFCFNEVTILVVASSLSQNQTNKQKIILPPKEEKKVPFGSMQLPLIG